MKKIIITLVTIMVTSINVRAGSLNFTELTNAVKESNNVTYNYISGNAYNDNNTKSIQEVNMFTQGDNVEVVTWSMFKNGKYSLSDTLSLAKDFELNNPDYKVVTGVNGDYFSVSETINSNVIFGNRVVNPTNHQKYLSVEFETNGSFVEKHKTLSQNSTLTLSAYNNSGSLIGYSADRDINASGIRDNEITYLNSNKHPYNKDNTYYELENVIEHNKGGHIFIEGTIKESTVNITGKKIVAINNNHFLVNKLEIGNKLIIQKEVKKSNVNNLIIGIDSEIISNGTVKEFNEIGGQSESNNTSRHPRTGFGYNENGKMILFTVDERQPTKSQGVDLREFGTIMKSYGIVNGFNLDGGGSTQAVYRNNDVLEIVNTPSETPLRRVGNALLFVVRKNSVESNLTYETINNNLLIDLTKTNSDLEEVNVLLNGINYNYNNNKKLITIPITDKGLNALSIVGKYASYDALITNDTIMGIEEEKPVESLVNVEISHAYIDNVLTITLSYDDPLKTIDGIRVYLVSPEIDKPALIKNSSSREVSFNLDGPLVSQDIKVVTTYNNIVVITDMYNINIETDEKINYIYFFTGVGIGVLALIMVPITIIVVKKRKR